mmetsp:Transcript_16503/g.29348  ORF Transcript_16503/g.29348 Transcript_16503/m.29348 type:complete len:175 (-) Transcript_16503:545-1069(-)
MHPAPKTPAVLAAAGIRTGCSPGSLLLPVMVESREDGRPSLAALFTPREEGGSVGCNGRTRLASLASYPPPPPPPTAQCPCPALYVVLAPLHVANWMQAEVTHNRHQGGVWRQGSHAQKSKVVFAPIVPPNSVSQIYRSTKHCTVEVRLWCHTSLTPAQAASWCATANSDQPTI